METKDTASQLRAAWQAPAFSRETIATDPWSSVDMAIPGDASSGMLLHARDAAARCVADTESYLGYDYETTEEFDAGLEKLHAAQERVAELDRLIEPNPQVALEFLEMKFETGYSRWTGEPLGEAADVGQSAGGKGQSHS